MSTEPVKPQREALVLMCGRSFSGKTTISEELAVSLEAEIVSLDSINKERGLFGGQGIPVEEWTRTHKEATRRVSTALKRGRRVVVDDISSLRFLRDNWRTVAANADSALVAVIVQPGLAPFEFGVACEIFGIDRSGRGGDLPAFDFHICAPAPGVLPTKTGFSIVVAEDLSATERADLVIVIPASGDSTASAAVHRALQAAHQRGAWILSVCSAAFMLAEAGLLDGRRATTHWMYSRKLAEQYPQVSVDENVLYVQDGTIITSAGTSAGIDACLHLVRMELGAAAATSIARSMVVPPHRAGGQAQYIDRPLAVVECDTLEEVLVWMESNLEREQPVGELASRAHMSERTFARRFKAETGTTPAAWLNSQRVLRAQSLLEETDLGIDAIARGSGFGQAVLLRHHFHKALGTSPAMYRRTFCGVSAKQSVPV